MYRSKILDAKTDWAFQREHKTAMSLFSPLNRSIFRIPDLTRFILFTVVLNQKNVPLKAINRQSETLVCKLT